MDGARRHRRATDADVPRERDRRPGEGKSVTVLATNGRRGDDKCAIQLFIDLKISEACFFYVH